MASEVIVFLSTIQLICSFLIPIYEQYFNFGD